MSSKKSYRQGVRLEIDSPRLGLLVVGCAALLSVGCVSQGKYDQVNSERDQLSGKTTELETEVAELRAANARLGQRTSATNVAAQRARQVELQQLLDGGAQVALAGDVLFRSGSAELSAEGRRVLEKVAGRLGKSSDHIVVIGHTDDIKIGSRLAKRYPTNWDLGGARASRVVGLLEELGVPGNRLHATSAGSYRPISANDDPVHRGKNRRVEIRLLPSKL